jgi:hypothetical protein
MITEFFRDYHRKSSTIMGSRRCNGLVTPGADDAASTARAWISNGGKDPFGCRLPLGARTCARTLTLQPHPACPASGA